MRATVLITNFNYARFLSEAIASALGQTHPDTEVVVVDDGSTDDSRHVIASYGDRIIPVLQDNAGQAAAFNAGFAVSRGELVCPLDSDDVLRSDKVARSLELVDDGVSVVYHQLQTTDANGRHLGKATPRCVVQGDISRRVERAGGWWPHPLTSGLAFTRGFLDRVLPIPVQSERQFVDTYLAGAAPFHGRVVGIREPLALNRLHGSNTWTAGTGEVSDPVLLRERHDRLVCEFRILVETLKRTGANAELSSDDNLAIQRYRWAVGTGPSRTDLVRMAMRCPSLPWPMRWRQAARLAGGRW